MNYEIYVVIITLVAMLVALIRNNWRPGIILFTVVVVYVCAGVLSLKEVFDAFSNRGLITVSILFFVSEVISQSGALEEILRKFLPEKETTTMKAQMRILPAVSLISAFMNNTPIVVITSPIIKRWCTLMKLPPAKLLLPICYAVSLGGVCTLIGTSTNLVVHEMMLDAGYSGFSMFELGKVGVLITIAGLAYMLAFSNSLLPDGRPDSLSDAELVEGKRKGLLSPVPVGFTSLVVSINHRIKKLRLLRYYEAEIKGIRWNGSFFSIRKCFHVFKQDGYIIILPVVLVWKKIFPPKKYSKFISLDILITIACSFAIGKAMINSGLADVIASFIIGISNKSGPYAILAILFIITNIITSLITNNAAATLSFPIALAVSNQLGVNAMPFFVGICIAASASFPTPIAYQTNLIVQGVGNYKFMDFVRFGLPLNLIVFIISILCIPLFWKF